MNDNGKSEKDIKKIKDCLKAAWNVLSDEIFEDLIGSMKRRIKNCIAAKEWHTKYWKFNSG